MFRQHHSWITTARGITSVVWSVAYRCRGCGPGGTHSVFHGVWYTHDAAQASRAAPRRVPHPVTVHSPLAGGLLHLSAPARTTPKRPAVVPVVDPAPPPGVRRVRGPHNRAPAGVQRSYVPCTVASAAYAPARPGARAMTSLEGPRTGAGRGTYRVEAAGSSEMLDDLPL